ncbi:MAG: SH3 domain-containing protein [Lachnospiraceae bacterium]|nr:SH3 domain-containing protein [Lachnospiraceae bacterium]
MKNPSYLKNRIMMNRVLTNKVMANRVLSNKALANKAILHKVLGGMVLGSVLFFASADAKAAGSVPGYVGLNLDPALGDLKGVKYTQEELLSVSREAHAFQGQSGLFAGDGASAGARELQELEEQESEYADLAIARVDKYVNVRSLPSTDGQILGKIYNGAVAHIIETAGEENDWLHVTSGNVEGYIKAEYFIYGKDAAEVIEDYVTRYAVITASRLNVRKETSAESKRIGYLDQGERAKIVENLGDWIKVEYSEGQTGYVSAEYVEVTEEFTYAISIEEEKAEIARQKALEERKRQEEAKAAKAKTAAEATTAAGQTGEAAGQAGNAGDAGQASAGQEAQGITPAGEYATNEELRDSLVEYALQFVGNKYVNGGNSLTNGTDCSGFTKLIYAEYGYSLGRTPSSQLSSAGRSIDYSEIQKGDIICYSSNGGKSCTHVAIYIGDGMIVHAANSKKGICTQKAQYSTIMGVKNIID